MSYPAHQPTTESVAAGRSTRLDLALAALLSQTPELLAASVVSFDGLAMASSLPLGMDEDRVAAMSAALLSLGERAAQGLGRGELTQVYVEGENGAVFLVSADDEAVLVAVSTKEAKIGLMLFEVRRAAETIAKILQHEDRSLTDFAPHAEPVAPQVADEVGTAVHVPTQNPAPAAAEAFVRATDEIVDAHLVDDDAGSRSARDPYQVGPPAASSWM